jgi:hypothetical protein
MQSLLGLTVAALEQLLHRHRTAHRARGRTERHHQAVA